MGLYKCESSEECKSTVIKLWSETFDYEITNYQYRFLMS